MHITIRAAGFSLMTMFVSCGVGAQEPDTRIGQIVMAGVLPAHDTIANLYAPDRYLFQQALEIRRHHAHLMTPSVH
jgi:hypothetical protein